MFDVDVNDDTMANVLSLMPNLESFYVGVGGFGEEGENGDITDASLTLLPANCPKLIQLEICAKVSDQGMCAILDGYRGNNFKVLKLTNCRQLTDITLNKVADTFPDIEWLEMDGTSVNKETVANLIAAKKLRVKKIGCPDDAWLRTTLNNLGHKDTQVKSCVIC